MGKLVVVASVEDFEIQGGDLTKLSISSTNPRYSQLLTDEVLSKQLHFIINKCDLLAAPSPLPSVSTVTVKTPSDQLSFLGTCVSLQTTANLPILKQNLHRLLIAADQSHLDRLAQEELLFTNERQHTELSYASQQLRAFVASKYSLDIRSEYLRAALAALGRLVGNVGNEEVLKHIFTHFCLGK